MFLRASPQPGALAPMHRHEIQLCPPEPDGGGALVIVVLQHGIPPRSGPAPPRQRHRGQLGLRHQLLLAVGQVLQFPQALGALVGPGEGRQPEAPFLGLLQLLAQLAGLGENLGAHARGIDLAPPPLARPKGCPI